MMKTIAAGLFAALTALPLTAEAQAYKCIWQDGVTYQDAPCSSSQATPGRKEVRVHQPTSEEVQQAEDRAARERARMQDIELEREADRALANRQRQADDLRKQAEADRCARLERDIRDTKRTQHLWSSAAIRQREETRLADMERNHFRTCFGRN